jgi:hypothetical protein
MVNIISGLLISVITAVVTVRLSLSRFRSERWWERKADTYSSIIESLHNMKEYCMKELASIESDSKLSEQAQHELLIKAKEGVRQISMSTDVGSFIISNKAVDYLKDFQKKYQAVEYGNYIYDYFDSQAALIEDCLNSLREIAKCDLGVR